MLAQPGVTTIRKATTRATETKALDTAPSVGFLVNTIVTAATYTSYPSTTACHYTLPRSNLGRHMM